MVISAILLLTFSGSVTTVEQPIVWSLQAPCYIITGGHSPRGLWQFQSTIFDSLGREGGFLSGYSGDLLMEKVEKYLESIMQSNTIFLILPKTEEFKELKELKEKYPELLPISFEEFDEFSPLVYLTYDIGTGKMRGVIVADEVDNSLAKILLGKNLPLNIFFRYKEGKLREIEKK